MKRVKYTEIRPGGLFMLADKRELGPFVRTAIVDDDGDLVIGVSLLNGRALIDSREVSGPDYAEYLPD